MGKSQLRGLARQAIKGAGQKQTRKAPKHAARN